MKTFTAHSREDVLTADLILEGMRNAEATILPQGCPMCGEQLRATLSAYVTTSNGVISHSHCTNCGHREVDTLVEFN